MGEKQRGEIILIAITSNRVKNKVEQKKISRDKIIGWNLYLTIVKQIRKISRKIVARSLLESGRIFKWDTHARFETHPRRWFYRSIFFFFFFFLLHTRCNCIRRHKSLLVASGITGVPSESSTGRRERERESKHLSGKEREGGKGG